MKKTLLLKLAVATLLLSGCETYKKQSWTPDGLNYTLSRDRKSGEMSDYVGLTWSLKGN